MKKIKIVAGIAWAFAALILILILFPGLNSFSASVSRLPFMKINPNYTGGEVARRYINDGCTLDVRKPVFDGFLRERKSGFIQLDWRGDVPDNIIDTIDYDQDNNADFSININRSVPKTTIFCFNRKVEDVTVSTPTSYGWAVRVSLEK